MTTHSTTDTLSSIARLSAERQRLWAKAGGYGRLSEAERGRLSDIHERLAQLWGERRQQQADARAQASLRYHRQRARSVSRRRGRRVQQQGGSDGRSL